MKRIVPVPDGFSVDLPELNLIINISPFPVIRPIAIDSKPYDVEDHLVWVHLDATHFGLFDRKLLNIHRCPTCGQEWRHEGEIT